MLINNTQIVLAILGSGAFSALLIFVLTWLKDWWIEKSRKANERKEKLYSRLKFYLMLTGKLESIQDAVISEKNKKILPVVKSKTETELREMETPFYEIESEVKKDWEKYAQEVLKLLEQNIQYVEDKHQDLINDIFENYFYQKFIYGESVSVNLEKIRALTSELRTGKAMQFSIAIKNLRDAL